MPDAAETVKAFAEYFRPERIRLAFLSPDREGKHLQPSHIELVDRLHVVKSVEVCWIDARDRESNGLYLADFFDFS